MTHNSDNPLSAAEEHVWRCLYTHRTRSQCLWCTLCGACDTASLQSSLCGTYFYFVPPVTTTVIHEKTSTLSVTKVSSLSTPQHDVNVKTLRIPSQLHLLAGFKVDDLDKLRWIWFPTAIYSRGKVPSGPLHSQWSRFSAKQIWSDLEANASATDVKIQDLLQCHTVQVTQQSSNHIRFESNFLYYQSVLQIRESGHI